MRKESLIVPFQVRFTEPEDVEKYGDDWYTYDELALITRPARELIQLERDLDHTLADVMRGMRADSVFGELAAAWIALKAAGVDVPAFEDFSPLIKLATWRPKPEDEDAGKGQEPAISEAASDPATTDTSSTPTDTVALSTMQEAG